jgi:hypothetical protein
MPSHSQKEDWINKKWRPMMGWSYMLTCIADFVIFPILWSLLQALSKGSVTSQWQPITLQGAGLYHIAMGAVLGVAAYGRTQEKLGGANNGGFNLPSNVVTTYQPPAPIGQSAPGNFGTPVPTQSWGSQQTDRSGVSRFGNNSAPVVTGFGGKPGPVLPPDAEI